MALNLYLVRHGQTPASRENRFCGHIEAPLTDVGRAMAAQLADAYGATPWKAIYSSPMERARDTAAPLAKRVGLEPILDPGLKEIGYGDWEGLKQDDVKAKWPDAFAYWAADVASRGTPGGETAFLVAARALPVIEKIRSTHLDGNVLVVAHKATLRVIVCALLGLDVRLFRDRIAQPVCAISIFEMKKTGPMLVRLGDVSHLSKELQNEEGT